MSSKHDDQTPKNIEPAVSLWLVHGLIAALVVLAYASTLAAPALGLDDSQNIFSNPYFTLGPWWRLWLEPYFGMYVPVTSTIWSALFQTGNGQAWPFRVLNLCLHLGNVGLVSILVRGLFARAGLRSSAGWILATAVFALHPLQVGAVAWISGGRDLLSAFFGLLACLTLSSESRLRVWARALGATVFFMLALLSKPQIAALPVALMAFSILFESGSRRKFTILVSISWCVLSGGAFVWTSQAQTGFVVDPVEWQLKPLLMIHAFAFYLHKFVWPFGLTADYGLSPKVVLGDVARLVASVVIVFVVFLCTALGGRRWPLLRLLLPWALLLLPVSGVVDFGYQKTSTVADHYAYLSMAILAALSGFLATQLRRGGKALLLLSILVPVSLAAASAWRSQFWKSDETLFTDVLEKNPVSIIALVNLTHLVCVRGRDFERGLELSGRALQIESFNSMVLANRGVCLIRAGRFSELAAWESRLADSRLHHELDVNPTRASELFNLMSLANSSLGHHERAWLFSCQSVAMNPLAPGHRQVLEALRDQAQRLGRSPACPPKLGWTSLLEKLKSETR